MDNLTVIARTAPTSCWSCGADTRIVSSILLRCGEEDAECSIADFTDYPALIVELDRAVADEKGVGKIKARFSKSLIQNYRA